VVYAEDINPQAVDYIRERAAREKLENVRPILDRSRRPNFPPAVRMLC